MESISNAASSVVNTASNLIYGQPGKDNEASNTTTSNETAGKEPLSGAQGQGTATEPYDQGNKATPAATPGETSYKQDDFLKLDPAAGKPTESFGDNTTGAKGESLMPIVPLNPDAASMGAGKTDTVSTTTTGETSKEWKPTALDEVKPEGAPGAGPAAPAHVTPATGDLSSSTSKKAEESTTNDSTTSDLDNTRPAKDSSGAPVPDEPELHSVGSNVDKILESQPKSKHTVDDKEASDPHSKMEGGTVRQTDASQHGESDKTKNLAEEKTNTSSASHGSGEADEEKTDEKTKLSTKEKIKQKLHIGHKDK